MSRVITFSRVFPSYHPRAGEPTYFVEKMIQWYWDNVSEVMRGYHNVPDMLYCLNHSKFPKEYFREFSDNLNPEVNEWKSHTIRVGQRFKPGDFFKPCVWTGKPYRSLQLQFLPALAIPKTWDVEFDADGCLWVFSDKERGPRVLNTVARNDGLTKKDLIDWFNKPLTGQIICWNESINY